MKSRACKEWARANPGLANEIATKHCAIDPTHEMCGVYAATSPTNKAIYRNYLRRYATGSRLAKNPELRRVCVQNRGACNPGSTEFCRANPTVPYCSCNLATGVGGAIGECLHKGCARDGYKWSAVPPTCNVENVDCSIVLDLGDVPSANIGNLDIYQKCQTAGPGSTASLLDDGGIDGGNGTAAEGEGEDESNLGTLLDRFKSVGQREMVIGGVVLIGLLALIFILRRRGSG